MKWSLVGGPSLGGNYAMTKKFLTVAVMCATALSPVLSTPAMAATTVLDTVTPDAADGTTQAAMAAACTAAAAAHAAADPVTQDIWTGTVVEGAVTWVSGPTEVGTHTFAANGVGTQTGAGTFTPAHKEILGDPYRNGGSVNMFGIQQAVGGHYSASTYDFRNDFTSTYSHAFSCDISEQVWHPAVHHDAEGHYVIEDNYHGSDEQAVRANCPQFTDHSQPWWGFDHAHCSFVLDHEAYDDPAYYDDDAFVVNEPQTAINQDQTDNLLAHEDAGEGFDTSATLIIGQVVVCISPSKSGTKLPGSWTNQNGYTGTKCNTTWYNGGATVGVPNLNDGSHNWVTVPVV
jgi:hypothetical protein